MRGLILFILFGCLWLAGPARADDAAVRRGAYLARAGDCTACHTLPGKPEFSGGLPINSPFGAIYATNITPDKQFGIGDYTLQDFDGALRRGVVRGKHLYPAMPYTSYVKLGDGDIADLYAYFMHGVAPVHEPPPATHLPFPFNQRWGLAGWNLLFAPRETYRGVIGRTAQWNRGAYLVQSLGHCGSCHTPRDVFFKEKAYDEAGRQFLAGGLLDNWYAPALSGAAPETLQAWSEADIAAFLKTGQAHGGIAFGAMKQVVEDSTQYMTDSDLRAMASYLKSLSHDRGEAKVAQAATPSAPTLGATELPGAGLYAQFCSRCHGTAGQGIGRYPALAGNPVVRSKDASSLIRIVLLGGRAPLTAFASRPPAMPGFRAQFSDKDVADVVTYIRSSWGNDAAPVEPHRVGALWLDVARNPGSQ